MSEPLVLSLFPGIGLLDMAFEEEGFCVVRGPDLLWGGDIRRFHPPAGRFDGVIGGPPCQAWSRLRHLARAQGYRIAPDMVPEFVRAVAEASPTWFLMENVPDAPLPEVQGYGICDRIVRDHWVGGLTSRERRFSYGWRGMSNMSARIAFQPGGTALHGPARYPAVTCDSRVIPVAVDGSGKRKRRPGVQGGTASHEGPKLALPEMLRRQGFPVDLLDDTPFTTTAARAMVGNGVPLPMGRAIARAVRQAIGLPVKESA